MKKIITMLSALTLTSSIAPLTVACDVFKDKKEEEIVLDLNELTSDMILNFDDSFVKEEDSNQNTTDKLFDINDFAIDLWIKSRLNKIFVYKLEGLSKSKWEKMQKNKDLQEIGNFMKKSGAVLMFLTSQQQYLTVEVKTQNVKNSKKFILTIVLKKWVDDKTFGQYSKSVKAVYDSIKGKEQGKVTVTIDFEAIKAIYDKQNK